MKKKKKYLLIAMMVLLIPLVVVFVVVITSNMANDRRADELEERTQVWRASLEERWQRPVLRGEAQPGDAAAEAEGVVVKLRQGIGERWGQICSLRSFDAEQLSKGNIDDVIRTAIEDHRTTLEGLRKASSYQWSEGLSLSSSRDGYCALRLLLVMAATSEPSRCLEIAADSIRITQDIGARRIPTIHENQVISLASNVAVRCGETAEDSALEGAIAEFRALAKTHFVQHRIVAHIDRMISDYKLIQDVPLIPSSRYDLDSFLHRSEYLDTWEECLDEGPFWSEAEDDFPVFLHHVREVEAATVGRGQFSAVAMVSPIRDGAEGAAYLRAVVIALSSLKNPEEDPPTALREPSLSDPFTGNPMRWRSGVEATLRSVGSNGVFDEDDVILSFRRRRAQIAP